MKKILLFFAFCASAIASDVTALYTYQTNHPLCDEELNGTKLPCPPKSEFQAGVIASAHSDDENVVAFLFVITYDLEGLGSEKRSSIVMKWKGQYYTSTLLWIAQNLEDFKNVKVEVHPITGVGLSASVDKPGVIVSNPGGR